MEQTNFILSVAVTALLWAQAAIVVISSVTVAVGYFRIGYPHYPHIVAIASSHCLFTILAVTAIEWGVYPLFSARGGVVFVAFVLSDWGLAKIFWVAAPKIFPKYFAGRGKRG